MWKILSPFGPSGLCVLWFQLQNDWFHLVLLTFLHFCDSITWGNTIIILIYPLKWVPESEKHQKHPTKWVSQSMCFAIRIENNWFCWLLLSLLPFLCLFVWCNMAITIQPFEPLKAYSIKDMITIWNSFSNSNWRLDWVILSCLFLTYLNIMLHYYTKATFMCPTSEQCQKHLTFGTLLVYDFNWKWLISLCSFAFITFFVALPHEATQGKTIIKIQTPESEHCQKWCRNLAIWSICYVISIKN